MEANVVAPDGQVINLTLPQVAPGRYQSEFTPASDGAYFIRVAGTAADGQGSGGGEEAVVGQTSGWVLGYSPEYRQFEPNPQLLMSLAQLTEGRDVSEDITAVLDHNLPSDVTTRPIWTWLTLLAVVLLPLDIAVRRLVVTRRDVARAWAATFGRLRPQSVQPPKRAEQLSRLFQAKERAGTVRDEVAEKAEPSPVLRQDASTQPAQSTEVRPSPPEAPTSSPSAKRSAPPGESLAARLLEKRRKEREEASDENES
jgi:hypothetical protein